MNDRRKSDRKTRFTALLRHLYGSDTLRAAYFELKKEAAPGVGGQTWRDRLHAHLREEAE